MNWMKKHKGWGWLLVVLSVLCWFPMAASAATPVEVEIEVGQEFGDTIPSDLVDSCFHYALKGIESDCPLPADDAGCELTGVSGTKICLSFDKPGVYHYDLAMDREPESGFYTCDKQHFTITVEVKEKDDVLTATPMIQNEAFDKVPMAMFSHLYQVEPTDPELMVDPPVQKTVSGTPKNKSTFTFELRAEDESFPMPDGSKDGVKVMTIEGSGEKEFGTWSYDVPGTYYYEISERDIKGADYVFDKAVYTITDVVEDTGGQLALTRTVTNQAQKQVEACVFINRYTGKETEEPEESSDSTEESSDSTDSSDDGLKKPSTTTKPSGTSGPKGTASPKTGDAHNLKSMMSWASLFLLLIVGSASYLWHTRQKSAE